MKQKIEMLLIKSPTLFILAAYATVIFGTLGIMVVFKFLSGLL